MRRLILLLFVGGVVSAAEPSAPAEMIAQAAADVGKVPAEVALNTRYLDLRTVPAKERDRAWRVLSGHINGISTGPDLVPPAIVEGSGGGLLRLNLDDYGWKRETWEQLANVDPHYHIQLEEVKDQEYGHYDESGRWVTTELRKEATGARKPALAPWLAETPQQRETIAALVKATQSQAPIVDARWFFNQTAVQTDRKPGYYDFLGVKNRGDFEKLIGFNAQVVKDAKRKELLEAVARSGITLQPRRIGAFDTVGGLRYWRTFDNRKALDKANPLRVLDSDNFQHDAEEAFGALPNGMWAWLLCNAKGELQDNAPDFIAPHDRTAPGNDDRVHVNLSCVRCHFNPALGGQAGIQELKGKEWARNLLRAPGRLQAVDYKVLQDLRAKYLRDLEGPIDDDRRKASRALLQATGFKPEQWAKAYGDFWAGYEEAEVDLAWAAADLGVAPDKLTAALKDYDRMNGSLDPALAGLIHPQPQALQIRQWEEAIPLAHMALRGYRP